MPPAVMVPAGTLLVVCPKSLAGHHMRIARLVNGEGWLDILTNVKPILHLPANLIVKIKKKGLLDILSDENLVMP